VDEKMENDGRKIKWKEKECGLRIAEWEGWGEERGKEEIGRFWRGFSPIEKN
jgi:hypothetical protein